ncbi:MULTISPECIES: tRNA lysidine(34) synthetase TilS [Oceanobacillus]|uniref:tRNA(Ile)-lysidine synthase n=1 Tax=Oceanobacillus indicireducens TaxID=1004261 RepID=A0A917Y2C4_9BACI|nr:MULTISPECIES: tRNA lysidine(34) synthetase TilS [Oceanobacillus]GGN63433.1 tRNA(Ile)-lysidine synthase [Oceanobacillus indicireducens]
MEKEVQSFIKKHRLLHKGARVLVGVSGGPDSIGLLHLLVKWRKEWELDIHALSLNHQLRGKDAEDDFIYVKNICASWGIPFHGASFDVQAFADKERLSTEVAARKIRYQFFEEKMADLEADYLALGHHGDDQVETLIMKLVRTASSQAFQGIPITRPIGRGMLIRPLLAVTKEAIESYCAENEIKPRIDATNLESDFTRNYYRHHVVPLLKERNTNIQVTAQHLSMTLAEDEEFLQKEAEKVLQRAVIFEKGKRQVTVEINLFKKYSQSLQRRAFHLILNYLYEILPNQLSYEHEEQFLTLIKSRTGNATLDFPHGLKLNRAYDRLTLYFEANNPGQQSFNLTLTIPGKTYLPNGSVLTATYTATRDRAHPFSLYIPTKEVTLPLHVRTRKNGDRMSWKGLQGTKKLKDIFIDAKVPLHERETWPIVVDDDDHILWLIGLKKGVRREVNAKQFIYIQLDKGN